MGKKNEDAAVQKNELSLQSEDKFRAIFEGANDGILVADAKTRKFILANSRICEITGYSQEELLKLSVNDIHPKKDLPRGISEFTKLLQRKIITAKDIPVLRKDKGVVYCDINSKIVKIGGRECLVGFFRDITERKKAEEKLKEREEFFSGTLNDMLTFVAVLKPDGEIVFVNNTPLKIAGMKLKNIIGKKFYDAYWWSYSGNAREQIMDDIRKAGSGKTVAHEIQVRTIKELIWIDFSIHSIFDNNGKVKYIVPEGRDITKGKQTEERYKKLYDSSMDAIMTLEPPKWNFTSGNPATVRMFRAKDEKEFTSKAPYDLSPKYQPDRMLSTEKALEMINKAMKEGHNFFEWTHKRINGEEFPATVLLAKVKIEDREFLQATIRDITQQKKAEQEMLKRTEELERFSKLSVGRELKMIELKKRIKELENKNK